VLALSWGDVDWGGPLDADLSVALTARARQLKFVELPVPLSADPAGRLPRCRRISAKRREHRGKCATKHVYRLCKAATIQEVVSDPSGSLGDLKLKELVAGER
jgi:hypothetical protein